MSETLSLQMIELDKLNQQASILVKQIAAVLNGPERSELLRFKNLAAIPELTGFQIATKCRSRRLPTASPNELYFESEMEPGCILSNHFHDAHEVIFVESGTIVDLLSGKAYIRGQKIVFEAGQSHKLSSPGGCRIYTQLLK